MSSNAVRSYRYPEQGNSERELQEQALPLPVESGQGRRMGRRTQRLLKALGGTLAVLLTIFGAGGPEDSIEAIRQFVSFLARGTPYGPSWLTPEVLATPARIGALLAAVGLAVWVFWPERRPKLIATPYGTAPSAHFEGKYVVGGRAEDEPGLSIGPISAADAAAIFAQPEQEFVPLEEAAQQFYDEAAPWLKEVLQRHEPFDSIADHAAALIGAAADEGVGELRASREAGLKPERAKFSDIAPRPNVLGKRPKGWVNPIFRRADLPKVLLYYKDPSAPDEPIKVRRDTPLREALMFAATGEWGLDPMVDGGGHLGALGKALTDFRQHAHDGVVTVWGRSDNHGVWRRIEPHYWVDHYVDLLDVLRSETRTKAYNQISREPLFRELMVCRAEFEAEWRKA